MIFFHVSLFPSPSLSIKILITNVSSHSKSGFRFYRHILIDSRSSIIPHSNLNSYRIFHIHTRYNNISTFVVSKFVRLFISDLKASIFSFSSSLFSVYHFKRIGCQMRKYCHAHHHHHRSLANMWFRICQSNRKIWFYHHIPIQTNAIQYANVDKT